MRYFAVYDENNSLVSVGRGYGGTEITEAEYNERLTEIRTKASLVNQLYNGEITISDVPTEWQEEIQRRVDERKAWEEESTEEAEATEADYLEALAELGVSVNEEN